MHPSSPSADYISVCTFAALLRQSRFCCPFPGELGSTTAHLRRLPRKGRAGGAQNLCSSIACRAQLCQRCSPVLQALIIFQYALLRLCFGRAVFCCPFPGKLGSTTAHLRRLPRKGRAGGAKNLCSSIACRAQPCQRCSPVLQALIYLSMQLYGSASAEPFSVLRGKSAAKRCNPPFFARQTVLYYNCIGACRKGSKPVRFTQGSVSRARCTEKAVF